MGLFGRYMVWQKEGHSWFVFRNCWHMELCWMCPGNKKDRNLSDMCWEKEKTDERDYLVPHLQLKRKMGQVCSSTNRLGHRKDVDSIPPTMIWMGWLWRMQCANSPGQWCECPMSNFSTDRIPHSWWLFAVAAPNWRRMGVLAVGRSLIDQSHLRDSRILMLADDFDRSRNRLGGFLAW